MLPPVIENKYKPPPVATLVVDNVFCVDENWVLSVLQQLRFDSGTGSDQISTKSLAKLRRSSRGASISYLQYDPGPRPLAGTVALPLDLPSSQTEIQSRP